MYAQSTAAILISAVLLVVQTLVPLQCFGTVPVVILTGILKVGGESFKSRVSVLLDGDGLASAAKTAPLGQDVNGPTA